MKLILTMALAALFAISPDAQHYGAQPSADDFHIVSDKVEGGVRTIVATPAPVVCMKKMEIKIDVKTEKIVSCVFTRGCNGNLSALAKLLKGMSVKEVIANLDGNDCGGRGTSCMDQLCRVLREAYKL